MKWGMLWHGAFAAQELLRGSQSGHDAFSTAMHQSCRQDGWPIHKHKQRHVCQHQDAIVCCNVHQYNFCSHLNKVFGITVCRHTMQGDEPIEERNLALTT